MQPRQASKCSTKPRHHRRAPFEARLHQVEPPPRRIHLFSPEGVGRARRETEAAVHARVNQRARWGMIGVECAGRAHIGPRPGLRIPCGSSARFRDANSG
jgi:hypothetical protein